MLDLRTLDDLALLRETVDLECKLAQGASGDGEVPKDFWPTYSAMANTQGGVVLLGVREHQGQFSAAGIRNPAKVRAELFNNLNNPAKVSANLLDDSHVQEHRVAGHLILAVHVPAAGRRHRPVFLHGHPLTQTYRRLNDGDRVVDEDSIKRMLAEQVEDERDARVMGGFGLSDFDAESLRVYRKLVADLKVPFAVKDGQRQDDTPVHQALREALVNTLVHADYTGRLSVLVVKRPDMFGFRNPGRLRLPIEQVIRGGESDCRNRILHQMFLLIGLGERGGSGMPKIYSGWTSQHWRQPLLREKDEPEQTLLELHMLDLLPEAVVAELRATLGERFESASALERMIIATAAIEVVVNHPRMAAICGEHPHDLSMALARLERDGLLKSQGQYRSKIYHLPGAAPISPEQVFTLGLGSVSIDGSSGVSGPSSVHSGASSGHNNGRSGASGTSAEGGLASSEAGSRRDKDGCLDSPHLDAPIVDDLSALAPNVREELEARASLPRQKKRLKDPVAMGQVILAVCQGRYLRLNVLAELLSRHPDYLRRNHLDELVKTQRVRRAFPATPTHEMQSYRSLEPGEKEAPIGG